jgi:hypothetical protein
MLDRLGLDECVEAAQIANAKFPYPTRKVFNYFFGVCWSKIRENEDGPV